ncbi:hypothetical protein, partial [Porcipelethomonas sp.]|uniref:hypothetical protein n=1 Tax=Porcipelethomonas sp. TaxID=2981675 RepID=UPI003EF3AA17
MHNNNIDVLKDLFGHSSENVYITDYDLNVLWCNKDDKDSAFSGISCRELFCDERLPLESGEYYVKYNGLIFSCRVINFPDCENGIYVIQSNGDDVMFSFIKCKGIREFLMNQSSVVRQAVTAITFSSNMLHNVLDEADLYSDHKYLDITMGNCYKLLRTVVNTNELIRYTDGSLTYEKIDLSVVTEEFIKNCRQILGDNIEIRPEIEKELYIKADTERLVACLLSLVVLVNGRNPENNVIIFTAERIGDFVSITAKAESSGLDSGSRTFSRDAELYKGDEVDSDLFVVSRFCRTFGGTLYVSGSSDEKRSFSMRFPFCN